ncbi:hypothetical protein GJ744_011844 [Endocarpon pusillum]|uniref:MICOS complex subunit MIC60 n=1 Tax=Endocarpon pusillum TaxID=364733 RepID=A0A8H7ACK4_9EURO|nr:hypothetical protein GJ744_011844 [Endocarpon pusillum]
MLRMGAAPGHRLLLGSCRPRPRAPWLPRLIGQRSFADVRKGSSNSKDTSASTSDPAFLPGSQSSAAPIKVPPPPGPVNPTPLSAPTPATPTSSSTISPENVPLTPPPPPPTKVQVTPPTSVPPPPKSPPQSPPLPSPPPSSPPPPSSSAIPPKQKRRRLRFLLYLTVFTGLSYGAAVFYALKSDNFHDFFTEYVPFGEEAVLYLEERSFQKRFPNARINQSRVPSSAQRVGNRVTIPSKSGISWKVSDEGDTGGSDLSQKGRHMSALDANKPPKTEVKNAQQAPNQASQKEMSDAVGAAKKTSTTPKAAPATAAAAAPVSTPVPEVKTEKKPEMMPTASPTTPSPKSEPRPPAIAPVTHLSPLEVPNADEPVVQELTKIVNDLITVINADSPNASNKYSAPIAKAKESLVGIAAKITALKEEERKAGEEKIKEARRQFDESTKELARRIDAARGEELAHYREEFEAEREKLSRSYEDKLKTVVDRAQQVSEQRLQNELTEQAIELKRKFVADIKSLVEQERDGRLSKISELSKNVDDLQRLTSDWNGVIDSNLATQQLQVAVDAVRSAISRATMSEGRPKPFLTELAALKEVANGDPVVDAAIASMNPTAYQQGVPSPAQLIDRFRRLSSEVRKASLLPENAGVASHAASVLLSKVMFRKQGVPPGDDVESVLAKTETHLEEGDLDGAAREMNTLQGWAGVLSKDWLQDCRKVLEVRQALDVIETEARLQCLRVE